ncbi:hypothetical protein BO97DRAFT_357910, partial [Aspergillus homomorphus CBS 101889]
AHTTTGCGKQGFPSAQPYLSHTPGANPFCCMFFSSFHRPFVRFVLFSCWIPHIPPSNVVRGRMFPSITRPLPIIPQPAVAMP